ncbi:MAG: hypothetical protein M3P12_13680 [Gemmatimonadota bacterium]|nr:hypothetical protein [Gemmatimonadota bacterium]
MTIEDRLRAQLRKVAGNVLPPAFAWDEIQNGVTKTGPTSSARWRLLTILLALAISAGAFAGLWLAFRPPTHVQHQVSGPTVPSPSLAATIDVGGPPSAITAGTDGVWVLVGADGGASHVELVRIDPSSNQVDQRLAIPSSATSLVDGAGSLWVTAGSAGTDTMLLRIDPATGSTIASIPVDGEVRTAGAGAIWAVGASRHGSSAIVKIDPDTNHVAAIAVPTTATAVAVDGDSVWVLESDASGNAVGPSELLRIDPQTNQITATIPVDASAGLLAAGGGSVWLERPDSMAIRVDEKTGTIEGSPIPIAGGFAPIGARADGVWFIGSNITDVKTQGGMLLVSHLNPATNSVDGWVDIPAGIAWKNPPSASIDPTGVIWIAGVSKSVTRVNP